MAEHHDRNPLLIGLLWALCIAMPLLMLLGCLVFR